MGLSGAQLTNYVQAHKYDQAISLAIRELRDGSVTGNPDGTIASLVKTFEYHKVIADKYDMDLVMYEGGTHVVGVGQWAGNQTLANFFIALNQSDAMGGLYLELMKGWKDAGGTLFNAFVDVAKHGTYGSWGALQHLDDQSERWDAIVEFNEMNPGWWEERDASDFIGTGEAEILSRLSTGVSSDSVSVDIKSSSKSMVEDAATVGKNGAEGSYGSMSNDSSRIESLGDLMSKLSDQADGTTVYSQGEGNSLSNVVRGEGDQNFIPEVTWNYTPNGCGNNDKHFGSKAGIIITEGNSMDVLFEGEDASFDMFVFDLTSTSQLREEIDIAYEFLTQNGLFELHEEVDVDLVITEALDNNETVITDMIDNKEKIFHIDFNNINLPVMNDFLF